MSKKTTRKEPLQPRTSIESFKRHYTAADGMPMVNLSAAGFEQIAQKIEAQQRVWFRAMGVPRGLTIPAKPLPESVEELKAELAVVDDELIRVIERRNSPSAPGGQEGEALARHYIDLSNRRGRLRATLRDAGHPPASYVPRI